ncbi:aminoglycoside phosphotransferase family protein [Arthrobacter gengyunqii]|uniref:Aminoglycoside phosphotransferase family protein n=1 Tax=Arthrobacter gengyunqii TaxID=2886940 RepID=A0A9X1M366_9MICC|nr:aminoglycoside phosphotransferase family protein [Arthrobacter gengyunqii]MCC3269797.1 aminoglycoside phosphotransferase family protein [Arthrobacter gengyunqii]UOY97245.1 aminoglycoside phosphotransferase family protein [Arthrobacter gengyunqii]
MSVPVTVPAALQRQYGRSRSGRDWLLRLPLVLSEAMERWELAPDLPRGVEPWHGHGALVLPVTSPHGPAVLKAAYPHAEALTEPAALGLWSGHGAVRLYASHSDTGTLLLERLNHRRDLSDTEMDAALDVWGGLVRKLSLPVADSPAWAGVPSLAERAEQLSDELPADWEDLGRPFERSLLEAALEVCQTRGAVGRRSSNDVLVHTDLHFGNILYRDGGSGAEQGFVAIDPQAMVGEPEFAAAPMLWNRLEELDPDRPRAALRRRLARMCSAAGLDPEIARQWSVLRETANALDYVRTGQRADADRSVWVANALAA